MRSARTATLQAWKLAGGVAIPALLRVWGADSASAADAAFFESRVRPVLIEHCQTCHGSEGKPKAGLRLDAREHLLTGGESGPAIVPGDPDSSLLIRAVRYTEEDLQMPPRNRPLAAARVADLEAWVRQGAPWPVSALPVRPAADAEVFAITPEDRAHWAFQPIRRPSVPRPAGEVGPLHPIDAFVTDALEAKGLTLSPVATPRELARRIAFGLTGLPPSPHEVTRLEQADGEGAFAPLVEAYLARPQYGERWGRYWLDVVRFAQSNGYERDGEKPFAWRYRDYVIGAFNDDKPFDRFIMEQLAGDEMPDATSDSVVATGFQRLGVWDDEPDDPVAAEFDGLDDLVSTTGAAFLGLTIGCARCHDHKFEPISQKDYYQTLAFFRGVRPYENARFALNSPNYLPLAPPDEVRQWRTRRAWQIQDLESRAACEADVARRGEAQQELERVRTAEPPYEWALGVREGGPQPPPTHILFRGNAASPGPEVQPAFLSVFGGGIPVLPALAPEAASSGRRLAFARWVASPTNPLTARVIANRVWQHHFGRGLVSTTTDFGRAGARPTHPELLDWLASEFIESGWSVKHLHRLILNSRTYRQSSHGVNAKAVSLDPGNELLWRQNLRRLDAEATRDTWLCVSGELNPAMGGRGFFPRLPGEVLAGASRPGDGWEKSSEPEENRRSVYTYIRRTLLAPMLETFDYSNTTSPLGERPATTVAPQALMLLNSAWAMERAEAWSRRLLAEAGPDNREQVRRGYRLLLGRSPDAAELGSCLDFLARQRRALAARADQLTFRTDVPEGLFADYMARLEPADFVAGPLHGWSRHRGYWSGAYEGIRAVDPARGPFVLQQGELFADGVVTVRVTLQAAAEFGSILLRSRAEPDVQLGYEVVLDVREQRLKVRRHGEALKELASVGISLDPGRPVDLRIEMNGARVRTWLTAVREELSESSATSIAGTAGGETQPLLDVTDTEPLTEPGRIGLRVWGAAMTVERFGVERVAGSALAATNPDPRVGAAKATPPDRLDVELLALRSLCLLLLNLNEAVYVD